jgi:16S rRNA (guanine966-N2)-methyltransferase
MRIITGMYKGRQLKTPANIRPTEDRVRKALFDILGDISGLSFLELFAGSGSVGLEALSQGAASAVFVEKDRNCSIIIEQNIKSLVSKTGDDPSPAAGLGLKSTILTDDAAAAVSRLAKQARKFDLIFADPPYYRGLSEKILQTVDEYDILVHASGFMVIQHFKKDPLPSKQGNLVLFKQSSYGDTVLSFYTHP